jgi:hypothetical protein
MNILYAIKHWAHANRAAKQGFTPLTLQQFSKLAEKLEQGMNL